jgi:Protein kinase domain
MSKAASSGSLPMLPPSGARTIGSGGGTQVPLPLPLPPRMQQAKTTSMMPTGAMTWRPGSGSAPPVTVTGVAPWAMQSQSGRPPPFAPSKQMPTVTSASVPGSRPESSAQPAQSIEHTMQAFIEKLLPSPSDADEDGATSSWKLQQSALTPTLLPTLKFHDLVFGRDLGSGAFSTVRYARQIIREKTRDSWPEFAVKMISAKSMRENAYHASVIREMAMLQLFSHPGIARLVSAFRYNDAAYMVLEYASEGGKYLSILDLHLQASCVMPLMRNNMSLILRSMRIQTTVLVQ